MFNGRGGGGGVPVEQFPHQFLTHRSISAPPPPLSSSSSSSSSLSAAAAAAARIVIPPPPNSSSDSSSNSSSNLINSSSSSFLSSFDHHHPMLFPPPAGPPLIPTHQNLFTNPPNNTAHFLTPPPTPHHHHHYNNNIPTTATTHREIIIQNKPIIVNDHDQRRRDGEEEIMMDIKEDDSWSNDEVIQLLKIKSSIIIIGGGSSSHHHHHQQQQQTAANWFTSSNSRDYDHFTWDHVSRKLAEMGYKKSAEKCKDKFEEETCRSFGNTIGYDKNTTTTTSYLITEELDEHLYNNNAHSQIAHHPVPVHESPDHNVIDHQQLPRVDEEDGNLEPQGQKGHFDKDPPTEIMVESTQDNEQLAKSKKRKRKHKKFKMVKGLCVELVNRMMAQQEEMHRKLLQDMAIRDEEKIKREEAWRKEVLERVQRDIQIREQEQEMARNKQSTITEFLNKIASFDQKIQIPCDINLQELHNIATNFDRPIHLTPSVEKLTVYRNQDHPTMKDDLGKRWPRDEVLALIDIRSKVNSGICGEHQGYTGNDNGGGSLWERISQGMLEVGYKRSAKRCKEKWENINKYFRKTKDANKKRSLDSRTCPYYHELNKLYNQEKVASSPNSTRVSSDEPENCPMPTTTPEN